MTRKYITIPVVLTFLLFALALMAQSNSGQTSNTPSGTTSSQNPNSPAGDEMSMPSQSGSTSGARSEASNSTQSSQSGSSADQSSQSGSSMGSSQSSSTTEQPSQSGSSMGQSSQTSSGQTASSGKAKTVEGCVLREETDYFLVPKHGNPIRVSSAGTGDISSHLGHQIKAHGTENTASNMGAGTSSQAGTSGTVAGGETSGSSTAAGQQTGGSVSSSTNPSGTSGATTGTTGTGAGNLHAAASREIVVDRVDMVSETCPTNWNPTYNPSSTKSKKSKSDQSNY